MMMMLIMMMMLMKETKMQGRTAQHRPILQATLYDIHPVLFHKFKNAFYLFLAEWENSCNELQRMLIVRSLRPDRVSFCATSFIVNNLGSR